MITADVITVITILLCFLFGAALGFGRWLKILTSGVFGQIISLIICYFLFGIVLDWYFVKAFMLKITEALQADGSWICKALLTIRLDLIVFGAVLFVVVQILRKAVVHIIAGIMQADNRVVSVANRILGVVLLTVFVIILTLIVFQVIAWVMGTEGGFYQSLEGSAFGLDKLFIDNPLNSVIESIRLPVSGGTGE